MFVNCLSLGLVERQNRSTLEAINTALMTNSNGERMAENKEWLKILECVAMGFHSRQQGSTKYSPYQVVFGKLMRLPVELRHNPDPSIDENGESAVPDLSPEEMEEMESINTDERQQDLVHHLVAMQEELFSEVASNIGKSQAKQVKNYNKKHKGVPMLIGAKVWRKEMRNVARKGGKMDKKWHGPYEVIGVDPKKSTHKLRNCSTGAIWAQMIPSVQLKMYNSREDNNGNSSEEETLGETVPAAQIPQLPTIEPLTQVKKVSVVRQDSPSFVPDTQTSQTSQKKVMDAEENISIPETQFSQKNKDTPEKIITHVRRQKKWGTSDPLGDFRSYIEKQYPDLLKMQQLLLQKSMTATVLMPHILSITDIGSMTEAKRILEGTDEDADSDEENDAAWKYLHFGVKENSDVNLLAQLAADNGLTGLIFGVDGQTGDTTEEECTATVEDMLNITSIKDETMSHTQMLKEAEECISQTTTDYNGVTEKAPPPEVKHKTEEPPPKRRRTLGTRRQMKPTPKPKPKLGSPIQKWQKSAFGICKDINNKLQEMANTKTKQGTRIQTSTETCIEPKASAASDTKATLAFHLNESLPNSTPPTFTDVTLETELDDDTKKQLLSACKFVKAPPVEFRPLSWAMRKDACTVLQIPFRQKAGDTPYINVGAIFQGAPTLLMNVAGDGNCFFRALSWFLTGSERNFKAIRGKICNYIAAEANLPKMRAHILPYHRTKKQKEKGIPAGLLWMTPGDQYLKATDMRRGEVYATQVEIHATACLLGKDIYTWLAIKSMAKKEDMSGRWVLHAASGDIRRKTRNAIYLWNVNEHFKVCLGPRQMD